MTKLEAVNIILRRAGMYPERSLDTEGRSDAAEAERCLDEEELKVQTIGWHYNMRDNVELTPDANGKIAIPDGTITIDSDNSDQWRNITQRGSYLYDLDNNTDRFDAGTTLVCSYTFRSCFECIPEEVASYIASEAACRFIEGRPLTKETAMRIGFAREERNRAKTLAFQINGDREDANTLTTVESRRVHGERGRVLSISGMGFAR